MHQTQIAPVHVSRANLILELVTDLVGLGAQHQAGSVAVEAMDDTGAVIPLDMGKVIAAIAVNQRIAQSAGGMILRRMADKACLLVEHQQILIFVNDIERDILRHYVRQYSFRQI